MISHRVAFLLLVALLPPLASLAAAVEAEGLHPAPKLPGVDLSWHMDRAITYVLEDIDRQHGGIPYYANRVYLGPARLSHAKWDVPHCVGRFLNAMAVWSDATGNRVKDKQAIKQLRSVLVNSISPSDHLAHFQPLNGADEVDMHSQRETLLGLTGLAKLCKDRASIDAAKAVIEFEQVRSAEQETISGTTYQVEWLGDTVWNTAPAGECVPLYSPARLATYGVQTNPGTSSLGLPQFANFPVRPTKVCDPDSRPKFDRRADELNP